MSKKLKGKLLSVLFLVIVVSLLAGCATDTRQRKEWKESELEKYCRTNFEETSRCPEDKCYINCGASDSPVAGCPLACYAKPCGAFSVEDCPKPCTIETSCSGEKICFDQYWERYWEDPQCGVAGSSDPDLECCQGLVRRCGDYVRDGEGACNSSLSHLGVPMCLPCGNRKCDYPVENACNCREDCEGTNNNKASCESAGGEWKEFPSYGLHCFDHCDKPDNFTCTEGPTWGCDCGEGKCLSGLKCVKEGTS